MKKLVTAIITLLICGSFSTGYAQTLRMGFVGGKKGSHTYKIGVKMLNTLGGKIGVKFELLSS